MKKILGLILTAGLLLCGIVQSNAATASGSYTSAATNSLLSVGGLAGQITIANSAASASTVTIYDAPSTNLTYTLSGYTNTTSYTTNLTNIITTTTGVSQTNINSNVLWTERAVVSASTNTYNVLLNVSIPAGGNYTYTPSGNGLRFVNGLLVVNTTNAAVTVTYAPDL